MKRCTNPKCKNPLKPESEFSRDRTKPDGLRTQCRECGKEYQQKRKHLKRDYQLEHRFGFLPGEFEARSKEQDSKCLICNQIEKLYVDHSYTTYQTRKLLCCSCNLQLGWYENNPVQEYLNKPEFKFCLIQLTPTNRKDYMIDYNLRQNHGICLDDYKMILESQNGVCGICFKLCATGRRLVVDHDHQTLRIRGLLCSHCNGNLGWYDNNSVNIVEYLNDQNCTYCYAKY